MITDKDLKKKFRQTWSNLVYRCTNPSDKRFSYYKNKGVCIRWIEYQNFEEDMLSSFVKHIVEYGIKETTIDRINNNKGYSSENCRWATWEEQQENSKNKKVSPKLYICKFCEKEIWSKYPKKYCNRKCMGNSQRIYEGLTRRERWKNRNRIKYHNDPVYREKRKLYLRKHYALSS